MQNRRQLAAAGMLIAGGFAVPALAQAVSPKTIAEQFAKTLSDHDIDAFAACSRIAT
jgi:hypothetical protein